MVWGRNVLNSVFFRGVGAGRVGGPAGCSHGPLKEMTGISRYHICNNMAAFRVACFNLGKETPFLRLGFCVLRQNVIRLELHISSYPQISSRQELLSSTFSFLTVCRALEILQILSSVC